MLDPRSIHLLIKHLDHVDAAVSRKLVRKRPWEEPALTLHLCDLLDEEEQNEQRLGYAIEDLNRDLGRGTGAYSVSLSLETHQYDRSVERYVTQSDLGLVINHRDNFLPERSWSAAWLLQAKRLYPDALNPVSYSEASTFRAIDPDQKSRIRDLQNAVGIDFVRYLLYCPRPSSLEDLTAAKLSHLRSTALSEDIFDYTLGLELYDSLKLADSTLAAGVFVSGADDPPKDLGTVHKGILDSCFPLSWFVATQFTVEGVQRSAIPTGALVKVAPDEDFSAIERRPMEGDAWARGIVAGRTEAVRKAARVFREGQDKEFRFFPSHTLTVNVGAGDDYDPEDARVRNA